jgi:hypothetical protein
MSQSKSLVWKYFTASTSDSSLTLCNLCNAKVSRGGTTSKRQTTTGMLNHLKNKHQTEYESETKKKCQQQKRAASPSNLAGSSKSKPRQMTLIETIQKTQVWDISSPKAKAIHAKIAEMIAVDIQPISIVENQGFKRLMGKVCPNYNIPSRKYFAEVILPDIYTKLFAKIKDLVSASNYLSLTTDIWTATTANKAFISLTAQWLSPNFELNRAVLRVKHFPESHSALNISEELHTCLNSFDIPFTKVHVVLRDKGANMVAGVRESGLTSLTCFIHMLQLCISSAILSQQSVSNILSTCRALATHLNHSPKATYQFEMLQKQLGLSTHKLKQDVRTRWNSTYYMLQRFLEQRPVIAAYTAVTADQNLADTNQISAYQWTIIEKLVNLLKPFEELTLENSQHNATSSLIIPSILALELFIKKVIDTDKNKPGNFSGIITMAEVLQNSLKTKSETYLSNKLLAISTFIDPRFKLQLQKTTSEDMYKWLYEVIENINRDEIEHMKISDSSESDSNQGSGKAFVGFSSYVSLDDCFAEIAKSNKDDHHYEDEPESSSAESPLTKKKVKLRKEIATYLSLPLLDRAKNPLEWWNLNKKNFRTLQRVALKYLSAPSSTVESERLFSTGGNIYEAKRSCLSPETGERLMFLHYNLPLYGSFVDE